MEAAEWDQRFAEKPWAWSAEPNMWVTSELSEEPPGRALDLGAGEGRNAVWLASRGWQVDAVDFSAVALQRASELAGSHRVAIHTHVADLTLFVPQAEGYDLALLCYLHLEPESMESVLHRAVTAVRPGGTLLLVGHDVSNLEHGVGGPQDPDVLTSVALVTEAWEKRAEILFASVERREVRGEDGQSAWALDTVVRARRH
ncbi:class I SAM-dependent methyltransferase [Streptomyces sp. ACA25]|uniref:class I SAM-dependent methyltransferase n=1 Tax=Streptomyces sp. ACA25 TaxID=3022596 RepID=UPI0023071EDA|nr:class I SAM-dependent methyltransferase [Streptomyces sp. ACA25]MDB1090183.1 class I SAM-dependent methyltransferase [Streptomyces sp. ACA25]